MKSVLIKSADDVKAGGLPSTLEEKIRMQSDLHKQEKWSKSDKLKFNKGKYLPKVLCLGRKKISNVQKQNEEYLGRQRCCRKASMELQWIKQNENPQYYATAKNKTKNNTP